MNFIDELLVEAEQAEEGRRLEMNKLRADHLLMAIEVLEGQVAEVNQIADDEIKLIQDFRRVEEDRLQKKVRWLAWNLDQFMRSTDVKTLRLPHGILKLRTGRDKLEIADVTKFLESPDGKAFLRVIPESYQPDLNAIHEHIKSTGHIPDGVNVISGEVKFTYQTYRRSNENGEEHERKSTETGTGRQPAPESETVEGQTLRGE